VTLEELLNSKPGITPEELNKTKVLPISRNGLYDAIKRGDIPSFRLGRKIIIPTAALKAKFQLV
jgi:Helix-turn-helix domain